MAYPPRQKKKFAALMSVLILSLITLTFYSLTAFDDDDFRFAYPVFLEDQQDVIYPSFSVNPEGCGWSPHAKVIRVLLLSYPRSGSSLTGELLSSAADDAYFFEPLHIIDDALKVPQVNQEAQARAIEILDTLFTCSKRLINELMKVSWQSKIVRKLPALMHHLKFLKQELLQPGSDYMFASKALVMKVIRLRLSPRVIQWLNDRSDIYVIHLVRDPRAQLFSIGDHAEWKDFQRDPWWICANMEANLRAGDLLSPNRYSLLRYEDLIENPEETTKWIFEFLGRPRTSEILHFIETHIGSRNSTKAASNNGGDIVRDRKSLNDIYYSTSKRKPNSHNAWKKHMPKYKQRHIAKLCHYVLERLKYDTNK